MQPLNKSISNPSSCLLPGRSRSSTAKISLLGKPNYRCSVATSRQTRSHITSQTAPMRVSSPVYSSLVYMQERALSTQKSSVPTSFVCDCSYLRLGPTLYHDSSPLVAMQVPLEKIFKSMASSQNIKKFEHAHCMGKQIKVSTKVHVHISILVQHFNFKFIRQLSMPVTSVPLLKLS